MPSCYLRLEMGVGLLLKLDRPESSPPPGQHLSSVGDDMELKLTLSVLKLVPLTGEVVSMHNFGFFN